MEWSAIPMGFCLGKKWNGILCHLQFCNRIEWIFASWDLRANQRLMLKKVVEKGSQVKSLYNENPYNEVKMDTVHSLLCCSLIVSNLLCHVILKKQNAFLCNLSRQCISADVTKTLSKPYFQSQSSTLVTPTFRKSRLARDSQGDQNRLFSY